MKKLIALFLFVLTGVANSATVQLDSKLYANSISGLVVDGVTYDVEYINATPDTFVPDGWITKDEILNHSGITHFLDDLDGGLAVSRALVDVLNDAGALGVSGVNESSFILRSTNLLGVLTGFENDTYLTTSASVNTSWVWWISGEGESGISSDQFQSRAYASFTVTSVPIPAAVWLFGSGLGLLGWFRRRQAA